MTTQQNAALKDIIFGDLKAELANSRRIIERVPTDKLDWRPHAKSYTLGALAQHVATLPRMFETVAKTSEIDLANWKSPPQATSTEALLQLNDETSAGALEALAELPEADLSKDWTLRMGEQVFFSQPKAAVLRTFAISHIVHHRAQLGVYLRLLDIPVPGLYGPSADEK